MQEIIQEDGLFRNSRFHSFETLSEFNDRLMVHTSEKATQECYFRRGQQRDPWAGGLDNDTSLKLLREGALSGVAASDKLLTKLETKVGFETKAFKTENSVVGGVPNVPAMLSGHPQTMRIRRRVMSQQAPLTVVIDLASSGSTNDKRLQRRGANILALVRLLSQNRPITLWFGVSCQPSGGQKQYDAVSCFVRADTAPLDLARVAHALTHTDVSRRVFYGYCYTLQECEKATGSIWWACNSHNHARVNGGEYLKEMLGVEEVLYVPAIFETDKITNDGTEWLEEMIAKYGTMEAGE